MSGAFCPECEHSLKLGPRPHKGQRVICPNCQASLIAVQIDDYGAELDLASNYQRKRPTVEIACPECENPIRVVTTVREGQPVTCPACFANLEVISVDPIEIDFAIPIPLKRNRYKKNEKLFEKSRRAKK